MNSEQQQYVKGLIEGRIKAPNHYVETLVDQLRESQKAVTDAAPKLQEAVATVERIKQHLTAMSAVAQQATATLLAWRGNDVGPAAEDAGT